MRPASVNPKSVRRPFECRVQFHARLRDAVLAPRGTAEPPVAPSRTPTPPVTAPPPSRIMASPLAPPPAPVDYWETDAGREQKADRERIEKTLNLMQAGLAELRESQTARLRDWQRAAVELAATMAARLLHERVATGEFPIEARVGDMLAQLDKDAPVTIRLHPTDIALLESRLGDAPLFPDRADARIIPDASLARGECRVESGDALLLSDVTRELQEIRDELLRSLGHARS